MILVVIRSYDLVKTKGRRRLGVVGMRVRAEIVSRIMCYLIKLIKDLHQFLKELDLMEEDCNHIMVCNNNGQKKIFPNMDTIQI